MLTKWIQLHVCQSKKKLLKKKTTFYPVWQGRTWSKSYKSPVPSFSGLAKFLTTFWQPFDNFLDFFFLFFLFCHARFQTAEAYFLTKPLSTMLKLTFLTTPPINPPTLSQLVSELFSSCLNPKTDPNQKPTTRSRIQLNPQTSIPLGV
jgi:hypothetical protein